MESELSCRIFLGSVRGLNDKHKRMLHSYFNSYQAIFRAKSNDLKQALQGTRQNIEALVETFIKARSNADLCALMALMEDLHCTAYAQEDEGYPPLLRDLGPEAPFLLYCIGNVIPNQQKTIAIVGTRRNSRYGAEVAQKLAKDLAQADVCVVSGMADGIDAFAHKGAIEGGGATVAVLGCGVDIAYPSANRALYWEIQKHGAVVSEYFPGSKPLAYHFPARNRIISGMSHGVLLVECPEHSGAMITARLCIEQGRELFVVPGNITSAQAEGSNTLLIGGASPVLNAEDILNRFEWVPSFSKKAERSQSVELSQMDKLICDKLGQGDLRLEELSNACSLSASELLGHLTLMEIRGIIKQLPGQLFALVRR